MKRALLLVALILPIAGAMAQETRDDTELPEELAVTSSIEMQKADELESSLAFDQYKYSQPSDERKSTIAAEFQLMD